MEFQTHNPVDDRPLKKHHHLDLKSQAKLVDDAFRRWQTWKLRPINERTAVIAKWAKALRDHAGELARSMTDEMGKPISQSKQEVEKCVATCDYIARHAAEWLAEESVQGVYKQATIRFESLGPVLAIMPWNFPLWQVIRFAAPAVAVGNTVLMKHSDLTAGTAALLEKILAPLDEQGPLLWNLPVDHEAAARIMTCAEIRGVTFTGSTRGGREIAATAGRHLKKTVLELGGSDAYLILADADLEAAAKICATARMVNGGQSCVAAKRFIVERPALAGFLDAFLKEMASFEMAQPTEERCRLGPLAAKRFQTSLAQQVEQHHRAGGQILLGGAVPPGPGAYYPATVILFEKRPPDALRNEELFGPVALVIAAENEKDAVELANDSPYGLGAAIFTADLEKANRLGRLVESGFLAINDQVKSDVRLPFGGVKDSGYGRELSAHGLREFCNVRSVAIGGS